MQDERCWNGANQIYVLYNFLPNKRNVSVSIPEVPRVFFFCLFILFIFYLLASSLTLSISAINDTSLSTMLKKTKKKERKHPQVIPC